MACGAAHVAKGLAWDTRCPHCRMEPRCFRYYGCSKRYTLRNAQGVSKYYPNRKFFAFNLIKKLIESVEWKFLHAGYPFNACMKGYYLFDRFLREGSPRQPTLVLSDNVRERAITLVSKAYSSLDVTVFASMTGFTLEEARRVAIERGWTVDGSMVQPCKIEKEENSLDNEVCLTEDQLHKLTQFVSFLEN